MTATRHIRYCVALLAVVVATLLPVAAQAYWRGGMFFAFPPVYMPPPPAYYYSPPVYESFDDLTTYCYGVASTVGLMSMYIVGFKTAEAVPYAIKLGVALQMTNILRDVGEDFRNGRIYLPQEDLDAYGITETDLASGIATPKWREFMKFQIFRTRQLYTEAAMGIKFLERDGQMSIGAASDFYQGILDTIEANNHDVFSKRASLSTWGKISRIPGLWLKLIGAGK